MGLKGHVAHHSYYYFVVAPRLEPAAKYPQDYISVNYAALRVADQEPVSVSVECKAQRKTIILDVSAEIVLVHYAGVLVDVQPVVV